MAQAERCTWVVPEAVPAVSKVPTQRWDLLKAGWPVLSPLPCSPVQRPQCTQEPGVLPNAPALGWITMILFDPPPHTSLGRKEGNQEVLVRDKTEFPSWPLPKWTLLRKPCSLFWGQRAIQVFLKLYLIQDSKSTLVDLHILHLILFRDAREGI